MATIRKRRGRYQVQVLRNGLRPVSKTFGLLKDAQTWARATEPATAKIKEAMLAKAGNIG